jgi:hypothetical protein
MLTVHANILDGVQLVAENIAIHIYMGGSPVPEWHGYFSVPGVNSIKAGEYRIIAEDGREGRISAQHVAAGAHRDTEVEFQGSGPFELPLR